MQCEARLDTEVICNARNASNELALNKTGESASMMNWMGWNVLRRRLIVRLFPLGR